MADYTLETGVKMSQPRGVAKGATPAADVTATVIDANHNGLDVAVLSSALPAGAATLTSDVDVTTAAGVSTALAAGACSSAEVQSDPANGSNIRIGGTGTDATHGFVLEPGQSYSVAVSNTNLLRYFDAVGAQTLHVVRRS